MQFTLTKIGHYKVCVGKPDASSSCTELNLSSQMYSKQNMIPYNSISYSNKLVLSKVYIVVTKENTFITKSMTCNNLFITNIYYDNLVSLLKLKINTIFKFIYNNTL